MRTGWIVKVGGGEVERFVGVGVGVVIGVCCVVLLERKGEERRGEEREDERRKGVHRECFCLVLVAKAFVCV